MKTNGVLTLLSLLASLVVSSPACAAEIIDTGAVLGEYSVIRWMDNQRVMFLAASGQTCDRKDKPDSYKQPLNRIAIFDIQSRRLSWYGEVGISGLCYTEGSISYARRKVTDGLCPKDEWSYLRGKFGEEKALPGVALDVFSCLPETQVRSNPAWLDAAKESGRIFKPLKPEHGWLEMDRGLPPAYPIAIHPPGKKDQPIPIDRQLLQPWLDQGYHVVFLRYEAFKDAYLLGLDDTRGAGDDKTGKLWWLYSDGRLEEILSYGRLGNWKSARYNTIIPTKTDLLLIGTETHPHDKSGLYREVAGRNLGLVTKGHLAGGGYALSPDGCKLAFGIDPKGFPNTLYRLHVLDVCRPGT